MVQALNSVFFLLKLYIAINKRYLDLRRKHKIYDPPAVDNQLNRLLKHCHWNTWKFEALKQTNKFEDENVIKIIHRYINHSKAQAKLIFIV